MLGEPVDHRASISVPGGVLRVDRYRGQPHPWYWTRAISAGLAGTTGTRLKRDIVIEDAQGEVVYRAGPYTSVGIVQPWNLLLEDVGQVGVGDFLARLRLRYGHERPYVVHEANPLVEASWRYYLGWFSRLLRRTRRG